MATEGFILGTGGEDITVQVEGIKLMALQNLSWKSAQKKAVIRGAGYAKPHGIGHGPKDYTLDFEVKELNKAILTEATNSAITKETPLKSFTVGTQTFNDLLDLRNLKIVVIYPLENNVRRQIEFTGVEFTEVSGGFSVEDEAVGRKMSAIACDASGLI